MTDDTPTLVGRCTDALADPTPADVLVLATLAESDGPLAPNEIAAATPLVNAYVVCARLVDTDLVATGERETNTRGQNPTVYELSAAGRAALDVETPEWTSDAVAERVLRELAIVHYVRELSSTTTRRLAREIPGASSQKVSSALRKLADRGVVEAGNADTSATTQWRLADPSEIVPFRAPTPTDGGTDR